MENTSIGTGGIIGAAPVAAAAMNGEKPRTLREATQQFESLFVDQLMQAMRGTVQESGLLGTDSGGKIFREMLDQEFAQRIAGSGGFGIGDLLYQQLAGPGTKDDASHAGSSAGKLQPAPAAPPATGKRHTGE